jgi:hypothetical protein
MRPDPLDVLKIDWDSHEEALTVGDIVRRLRWAGFRLEWWREDFSPSGSGRHLVLRLAPRPKNPYVIVALQAILGSDPYREAANVQRVRSLPTMPRWARRMWNTLYTRKEARWD